MEGVADRVLAALRLQEHQVIIVAHKDRELQTGVHVELVEYLAKVVTPTLERHKQSGAIAEKFEAAYLRSLDFSDTPREEAARVYASGGVPSNADYKKLQDFLFRYIAAECGRLGLPVHLGHDIARAALVPDLAE